jgi:hypothetical protein
MSDGLLGALIGAFAAIAATVVTQVSLHLVERGRRSREDRIRRAEAFRDERRRAYLRLLEVSGRAAVAWPRPPGEIMPVAEAQRILDWYLQTAMELFSAYSEIRLIAPQMDGVARSVWAAGSGHWSEFGQPEDEQKAGHGDRANAYRDAIEAFVKAAQRDLEPP